MPPKDPNDVTDYSFDWSRWLTGSETIVSFTATASGGLVLNSTPNTNTASTVWLSGGVASSIYEVQHLIVTSAGRTKALTMTIRVQNN